MVSGQKNNKDISDHFAEGRDTQPGPARDRIKA